LNYNLDITKSNGRSWDWYNSISIDEQSRTHNSETTKPTKVIIAGDSM
jgi:hypothetical protein